MENWVEKRIDEIADFNPRESISKGTMAKKIAMEKLQSFCRDVPGYAMEAFSGGTKFRNGDTIMARITPCLENGKTAMVNILDEGEVGFGSTEYIVFRAKQGYDPYFIYYLVTSPVIRDPSIKSMVGSSGRQRVQTDVVQGIKVKVPSLAEQKKIACILKDLDDKIAVNNEINKNLQHQARMLYKAWFEDLVPFHGQVPANWTTGKLKDVLQLKRNATKAGQNQELPYLPIDVIPMNTFALSEVKPNEDAQSSLITFDRDDIVVGAMRIYFHRVVLAPFPGITRTTCFTLAPYDGDYLSFSLLCCDQDSTIEYAQTTSKGSTMPYAVWDGGLGDMRITIPDKETAHNFNELVLPMLRHIQASFSENRNLKGLRDSLLPKLMSGEIDVSDLSIRKTGK